MFNTLLDLQTEIHQNAINHGWWENERSFGEIIALCHSELSEALEEDRAGRQLIWYSEDGKPEGIATELADCIIRILDWCDYMHVDIGQIIQEKHAYNKTRPYKHGGKKY